MHIRLTKNPKIIGETHKFNTNTTSEVIVTYNDGSMETECISDLEVLIGCNWIPMMDAFKKRYIISDIYNEAFFEAKNNEEMQKGYRITTNNMNRLKAEALD